MLSISIKIWCVSLSPWKRFSNLNWKRMRKCGEELCPWVSAHSYRLAILFWKPAISDSVCFVLGPLESMWATPRNSGIIRRLGRTSRFAYKATSTRVTTCTVRHCVRYNPCIFSVMLGLRTVTSRLHCYASGAFSFDLPPDLPDVLFIIILLCRYILVPCIVRYFSSSFQ